MVMQPRPLMIDLANPFAGAATVGHGHVYPRRGFEKAVLKRLQHRCEVTRSQWR